MPQENGEKSDEDELEEEVVDVPKEIEVEEEVEKEVMEDVIETRKIPQVRVAHAYTGQGMKVERGEVKSSKFIYMCLDLNLLGHLI